jgi:hypothetical protein
MVKKEIEKNIMSFTPINEKICTIRHKGKFHNVILINVHAPTEEKTEEEKDKFCDDLQRTYETVPKHVIVLILGDLNAKIGKEKAYENVTGKHTLHEVSNQTGELVCNFAIENNMTVMSTQFQHKTIHKGTWTSPNFTTVNQIDHVLINTTKKRTAQNIRTLRGLNRDSDHFLVKTIIKQRLITKPRGNIDNRKKWNLVSVQNSLIIKQYRQKIYEKFLQKRQQVDINQEWENIKNVMLERAEETKHGKRTYVMSGGSRNVQWLFQEKTSQEGNAYKKELEHIKNNINKREKKLIRSAKRKRNSGYTIE